MATSRSTSIGRKTPEELGGGRHAQWGPMGGPHVDVFVRVVGLEQGSSAATLSMVPKRSFQARDTSSFSSP